MRNYVRILIYAGEVLPRKDWRIVSNGDMYNIYQKYKRVTPVHYIVSYDRRTTIDIHKICGKIKLEGCEIVDTDAKTEYLKVNNEKRLEYSIGYIATRVFIDSGSNDIKFKLDINPPGTVILDRWGKPIKPLLTREFYIDRMFGYHTQLPYLRTVSKKFKNDDSALLYYEVCDNFPDDSEYDSIWSDTCVLGI